MKGQYGSNHVVPDIVFWIKFWTPKRMSFWWRFLWDPGKGNMGQTIMSQIQINKRLNTKKYRSLGEDVYKILKRTIWVKPYCPWVFRKLLNTKRYMSFRLKFLLDPGKDNIWNPWKDNKGETALPLGQNFLEILKKFQQWIICVLIFFSKAIVWVNPYCLWFKLFKRCLNWN